MKTFFVNKSLIWDYDFSEEEYGTEKFRKFYVGRVLMRGTDVDLKEVGLEAVRRYLPDLDISRDKREFWEWYFARKAG
ncbi:MAG: hypothetical protein HW408_703 [Actinobacteria bacterium]|nr:hypothetical protein [Actinomycetota bacterium]